MEVDEDPSEVARILVHPVVLRLDFGLIEKAEDPLLQLPGSRFPGMISTSVALIRTASSMTLRSTRCRWHLRGCRCRAGRGFNFTPSFCSLPTTCRAAVALDRPTPTVVAAVPSRRSEGNNVTEVSVYGINKMSHLLQVDPAFRDRMASDPADAIAHSSRSPIPNGEAILFWATWRPSTKWAHTRSCSRVCHGFSPGLIDRDRYVERMRSTLTEKERAEVIAQSARSTHR